VDDVGGVNAGGKFLFDALKQSLGAGALDLHLDLGILRLEGLSEFLPHRQIHRGIEHHLAFLFCCLDQLWRDRLHLRGSSLRGRGENRQAKRRRSLDDVAPGWSCPSHPRPLRDYRLSARQRSAGSVSQTSVPGATAVRVEVTARNTVPSEVSTM